MNKNTGKIYTLRANIAYQPNGLLAGYKILTDAQLILFLKAQSLPADATVKDLEDWYIDTKATDEGFHEDYMQLKRLGLLGYSPLIGEDFTDKTPKLEALRLATNLFSDILSAKNNGDFDDWTAIASFIGDAVIDTLDIGERENLIDFLCGHERRYIAAAICFEPLGIYHRAWNADIDCVLEDYNNTKKRFL
jgi:hypothetical protein